MDHHKHRAWHVWRAARTFTELPDVWLVCLGALVCSPLRHIRRSGRARFLGTCRKLPLLVLFSPFFHLRTDFFFENCRKPNEPEEGTAVNIAHGARVVRFVFCPLVTVLGGGDPRSVVHASPSCGDLASPGSTFGQALALREQEYWSVGRTEP